MAKREVKTDLWVYDLLKQANIHLDPQGSSIKEIDTANTQEELNEKEQYWIKYYNSVIDGYNETDAISKCGGNTYQSKTEKEME